MVCVRGCARVERREKGPADFSVLKSILAGMARPSVTAAGTALGTVATLFLAYCLVFGAWFTASDSYRYLMTDDLDTYTNVTHKVLSRQGSHDPAIVVLGTSVMVRCVAGEEPLSALVQADSGRRLATHDLATDAQTSWEMLALVDRLPPNADGVLVIGLSPGLLEFGSGEGRWQSLQGLIDAPKLGFVSAVMDRAAEDAGAIVPLRTGIHALDNAAFFLSRRKDIVKNLLGGGKTYGEPLDAYWYKNVNRPDFWQSEIEKVPGQEALYRQNAVANFTVLESVVTLARQGGAKGIVIVEAPLNPGWNAVPQAADYIGRYRQDLADFASRVDATLVRTTDDAGLIQSDFVDYEGHLGNAPARERCMGALARGIGAAMGGTHDG